MKVLCLTLALVAVAYAGLLPVDIPLVGDKLPAVPSLPGVTPNVTTVLPNVTVTTPIPTTVAPKREGRYLEYVLDGVVRGAYIPERIYNNYFLNRVLVDPVVPVNREIIYY